MKLKKDIEKESKKRYCALRKGKDKFGNGKEKGGEE